MHLCLISGYHLCHCYPPLNFPFPWKQFLRLPLILLAPSFALPSSDSAHQGRLGALRLRWLFSLSFPSHLVIFFFSTLIPRHCDLFVVQQMFLFQHKQIMSVEASRTCFLIDSLLDKKPKEEFIETEEDEEEEDDEELSSSEVTRWVNGQFTLAFTHLVLRFPVFPINFFPEQQLYRIVVQELVVIWRNYKSLSEVPSLSKSAPSHDKIQKYAVIEDERNTSCIKSQHFRWSEVWNPGAKV